jgi:hypothetical protein
VRDDFDLAIADLLDLDIIAEVAGTALDLDAVVQELFERGDVEDLVGDGLGAVDGVLLAHLLVPVLTDTAREGINNVPCW